MTGTTNQHFEQEPNWRESERETLANAFAKITAGCPCDDCPLRDQCDTKCRTFKSWVRTGK
jgi:hypothetical protein